MKDSSAIFIAFIWLLVVGFGLFGWVMNIIKLVPMDGTTGMMILRAVGIFVAPLGVVLGYVG